MKIKMITPGGKVEYEVHVMKVPNYTLDNIFEKNLLFLLPFYIFSHEKKLEEYNTNQEKLDFIDNFSIFLSTSSEIISLSSLVTSNISTLR